MSEGGSPAMIDMHEATANALNQLRMDYRLCLFHSDKAILDYFSLHLLIQVSPVVLSGRSDFTGLGLGQASTDLWTLKDSIRLLS